MINFKTRIKRIANEKGKIILANDYTSSTINLESKTIKNLKTLNKFLCGIKLNFHVLLPLGFNEIKKINKIAHQNELQTIADIKLNDIQNTNKITVETLWDLGFDAVIVNPIMGPASLKKLVTLSHKRTNGIIALCHMSSPHAKLAYDVKVNVDNKKKQESLYQVFLRWSISNETDGIVVGATFPEIIKYCKKKAGDKLSIYSPGIGTQGGSVNDALSFGSDYLIVGRSILNAKNPINVAKHLQQLTLGK